MGLRGCGAAGSDGPHTQDRRLHLQAGRPGHHDSLSAPRRTIRWRHRPRGDQGRNLVRPERRRLRAKRSELEEVARGRLHLSRPGRSRGQEVMRIRMRRLVTVLAVPLLLLTATAPAQVQTPAAARPNIVLIMSDDMGYGDL